MASGPGYAKSPDHKIAVAKANERWFARIGDEVLADSDDALCLEEDGYPLAVYFPRRDVEMHLLSSTRKRTYCPFKGDASYLALDGEEIAWCYAAPYDELPEIAGRIAFDTDKVAIEPVAE